MRKEIAILAILVIAGALWWMNSGQPLNSATGCPASCAYGCVPMTTTCRALPCPSNCSLGCVEGTDQCRPQSNASNVSNASILTPRTRKITSCGVVNESSELSNDIRSDGTCLTIENDSITLDCKWHTITGNANPDSYGIYIKGKKNVTIRNCEILHYSTGVLIDSSMQIHLLYVRSRDNFDFGILVNKSRDITLSTTAELENPLGILLNSSTNISIAGNYLRYNQEGIDIESSEDITLANNQICSLESYDIKCQYSSAIDGGGNQCNDLNGCSIRCSDCPSAGT